MKPIIVVLMILFKFIDVYAVRGELPNNLKEKFLKQIEKSTVVVWEIRDNKYLFKGSGVLISENKLITAAHVVSRTIFTNLRFTFGSIPNSASPSVTSVRIHPEYFQFDNETLREDFDITLIHLNKNIIKPNQLRIGFNVTDPTFLVEKFKFIVSGFGAYSEANHEDESNHIITPRPLSYSELIFHKPSKTDKFFVTPVPSESSACPGDSGGPVWSYFPENNYISLVGLVHGGGNCDLGDGEYLILKNHLDFISEFEFKPQNTEELTDANQRTLKFWENIGRPIGSEFKRD